MKRSRLFLMTLAFIINLFIGWLDYITGYELHMSAFYMIPVFIGAWFVGKNYGIVMSFLGAVLMFLADIASGSRLNYMIESWNTSLLLVMFIIFTFLLSKLKKSLMERERLVTELQQSLKEIKKLSGFLPICAACKKIRDDEGYWNNLEAYISEHSEAQFTHGICPDCKAKIIDGQESDKIH